MKRGWRCLTGVGVVFALLLVGGGTFVATRAAGLQRRIELLRTIAASTPDGPRAPVRGNGRPGNAWDHYVEAARRWRETGCSIPWNSGLDRGDVAEPGEAAHQIADAVREGAETGSCSFELTEEMDERSAHGLANGVGWLAVVAARRGDVATALSRYLDELWFCIDYERSGLGVGPWSTEPQLEWTLQRVAELVAECSCVEDDALRRGLRFADALFPSIAPALARHASQGAEDQIEYRVRNVLEAADPWFGIQARWLQSIAIVQTGFVIADRTAMVTLHGPWPHDRAMLQDLVGRIEPVRACGVSVARFGSNETVGVWIALHRAVLAKLRLLRAAVGVPPPLLADPFGADGATIQCRHERDRDLFWSVGPDGVDDGGDGADRIDGLSPPFRWAYPSPDRAELHGDLTLVVPRRSIAPASSGR